MDNFYKIFNKAMELIILGLYEKKYIKNSEFNYNYSPLLKKGLDKFSLLNLMYFDTEEIFPTNEYALIESMSSPFYNLIDKLPNEYKEIIKYKGEWNLDSNFISTSDEGIYYIEEDLNDLIFGSRKFRKSIRYLKNAEFELESQKFFELMLQKTQMEYVEIRNFFEQRNHTYLTNSMLLKSDEIMNFKLKYDDIMELAYEEVNYLEKDIKLCPYCNLVLRERANGDLYCISDKCSKKSKGFLNVKPLELNENIFILKHNVAYSIYYFGMIEQDIKRILDKNNINYKLWPNFDKYDFELKFNEKKIAIEAKNIKNYQYVIEDIKQMSNIENDYDRVLYVVPNEKPKYYLEAVNKSIINNKYRCIKLNKLKQGIENGGFI